MYDISWPDKIITTNKYGTMRSDWSKLDEIAEILENKGVTKATLLAELYYGSGKAGALYELLSHKDDDTMLNIKIYDVAHIVNGSDINGTNTPLIDRKEILGEIFGESKYLIKPILMNNKLEVDNMFNEVTDIGDMEGIVVKGFDGSLVSGPCSWVKIKKKDQSDYEVVEIDKVKERIEINVPNPNLPVSGQVWAANVRVGVKCMNNIKATLQVGDYVTIEHQGVLDSGSLRHPVYIGKAVKGE
jgi:hypothetical protein